MQDCLAVTGADTSFPLLFAAALLLVGLTFAVVAIRRRRSGALLMLALPFLAGALVFGGQPLSAQAASPQSCETPAPAPTPTPTPSEVCQPEDAVADADFTALGGWLLSQEELAFVATFSDEDMASYTTIRTAIAAIDDGAASTAVIVAYDGGVEAASVPVTTPDGYLLDGTELFITDEADGDGVDSMALEILFEYDNGCGGTLTTAVTFEAFTINIG